jgi:hypothetical protein
LLGPGLYSELARSWPCGLDCSGCCCSWL